MEKDIIKFKTYLFVITALLMSTSWAQRPSFAGSRPPNGLNQKDKYHTTNPTSIDIENRFGSVITNQIPFGQPQKPPVGYPVVLPESVYTVLPSPVLIPTNHIEIPAAFEDRFGDTRNSTSTSSSPLPSIHSASSETSPHGVPLDAHGDQLLIDHLSQTPIDKRPFWFINYQAIEAQRNGTATNFAGAQGTRGSFAG